MIMLLVSVALGPFAKSVGCRQNLNCRGLIKNRYYLLVKDLKVCIAFFPAYVF